MLVHATVFWGMNAFLAICYRYNLFPRQRIQGKALPNWELTKECLKHCFINHFIVAPFTLYFGFPLFKWSGMVIGGPIPPFYIFIKDIIVSIIVNDTLFYWGHKLLHHKSVYKYCHKQHHQFKINTGISSEYAHPIEHLFSNIVPVAGNLLVGSHIIVFWVWLAIRIGEIVDTHSGYNFEWSPYSLLPWQGGADRHDFHHSHNDGCYGSFTIFWDQLMGTDAAYNRYVEKRKARLEDRKWAANSEIDLASKRKSS